MPLRDLREQEVRYLLGSSFRPLSALEPLRAGRGELQARAISSATISTLERCLPSADSQALLEAVVDHDPHAVGEAEGHALGQVAPADLVE